MGLCLLSLKFYGQYWQGTFFRTFRAILEPALLLPLPRFGLVHFCQYESASHSLYRYTRWCTTGWGWGRWRRGSLLRTPRSPPSHILCLHNFNVWPFFSFLLCKAHTWLCKTGNADMLPRWGPRYGCTAMSPLASDLQFGCCVILSILNGLLSPNAPDGHDLNGPQCAAGTRRHPTATWIDIWISAAPNSLSPVHCICSNTAPASGAD